MYKIILEGIINSYEYEELIKVFLKPGEYVLLCEGKEDRLDSIFEHTLTFQRNRDKNLLKKEIYIKLSALTGIGPEWGILTGVRPVKVASQLLDKHGSFAEARQMLLTYFMVSEEKTNLLLDICQYQRQILDRSHGQKVGVYIGIPFCPTRCLYCSFPSNQVSDREIARYLAALHEEIQFAGNEMAKNKLMPESVYIGGGTPTTLSAQQLDALLGHVKSSFDMSQAGEFTVEAGRPDTITAEKLQIIKNHGVDRISINPQSMKDGTLELIGRSHNTADIESAFALAKEEGISIVNADIIAGLPEETPADFAESLEKIIGLGAENITVHTLAVKRASRLAGLDSQFHYKQAETVRSMLENARQVLGNAGYRPYYLYRQKHMAGNLENVGYCKGDTACIYNIRIMEEMQTIVALGAGGMSKAYFPEENRHERVANVSNYEIYIERLEEMLQRKKDNLF